MKKIIIAIISIVLLGLLVFAGYIFLNKNDEKNYLVPYNFDIILNIDLEKKRMCVKNIVGLFD